MKASDLFVRCLEEEGIEYVFGVPGEENADFIFSLSQSKKIRFVLTRHEQGAAFMAEVYGRLTGNPAGCLGTLGPGATNLITGVADANMDRAPILVLTGQGASTRLHKESHQIMDVVDMFRPVTKWAISVRAADTIPEIVRKAVRLIRSEKPGAVLIELPEDIAKNDSSRQPITPLRFRRPAPDDKIANQAFARLRHAKKPIIIAGNGTIRRRAAKQLRAFCDATGIGVLSTFMGKGAVDMDAPYSLFTIGLGQKDIVSLAVDEADLVLAIGYDLVEYPPSLWNPQSAKDIINIDFHPCEIDAYFHPETELVGDIAHSLWMLNERLKKDPLPAYQLGGQKKVRARMLKEFAAYKDDKDDAPVRPQKILWDVRQALAADDILLSGVGAHKMWIARYYHCHQPNTCLIPNGFCSMGMPLPGAIAAHLVFPERKILGIAGDGDFMMNVQEMETARRLNADINLLVWEDKEYGLIAWKQHSHFGSHTDLSFTNPDWNGLARAFGWQGHYVKNAAGVAPALKSALAHKGPSLIVVPVDYRENLLLNKRLGEITMQI